MHYGIVSRKQLCLYINSMKDNGTSYIMINIIIMIMHCIAISLFITIVGCSFFLCIIISFTSLYYYLSLL